MRKLYKPLEKSLGYRFRKKHLLQAALTHPSFRYESESMEGDNQRLEFLGDAALGLVAAAYLFDTFEHFEEGVLTQARSCIANTKTLARLAASIDLGVYLRLGHGELKSGGHERPSNLGDALEAVIGAAYQDGGLRAVNKIFKKLFVPEIPERLDDLLWMDNPKGALQELAQHEWKSNPQYHTLKEDGPAHSRLFTVEVSIGGQVLGIGHGSNKRDAETEAAREALHHASNAP